jgi:hypothetical protein
VQRIPTFQIKCLLSIVLSAKVADSSSEDSVSQAQVVTIPDQPAVQDTTTSDVNPVELDASPVTGKGSSKSLYALNENI